ncbi:MAG: response regulator [Agriterribacter sp.]
MKSAYSAVILIVDDRPANILVLESLLALPGRTLLTAGSGAEALKISFHTDVDLIILDVQMPDMDGFEVAQVLKTNKRTKNIPIIFATAESKERTLIMKGYEEGAVDYLLKPLDPEVVKAKVNVLLKIQLQKKELLEKNSSLERSELLINNSSDIIGIIDADTLVIEEINDAFTDILGYSVDETKGKLLTFFLQDENEIATVIKGQPKNRISFEAHFNCKDGSQKWLQWKVTVKSGKWFVNARDITEVKLADERIRQLNDDLKSNVEQLEITNKELESFSYSVSHDLRSPLRALNGYAKIIEEEYLPQLDDEAQRLLKNIKVNAQKMGMLIDDLLAFSRLGRKEVQRSKTDIMQMVDNILQETIKPEQHHAEIKVAELPPAEVDHTLMQQVWVNLISNAVKYSSKKDKPKIEIGAEQLNNETVYYVKDNGSGFDMKYVDKLFGVFQRLHSPKEFEGTGVGLAIVHRIITKHRGRIWVDAKVNEGASFYFTTSDKTTEKIAQDE